MFRLPPLTRLVPALALGIALTGAVTSAMAREPLPKNAYINQRLIAAQIADIIRHECPSLGGRVIYALFQAGRLKNYALDQGYTKAEIEAFVKSKVQKRRVRNEAETYLTANGAKAGDAQSYCAVGRSEMQRKTLVGSLLFRK